MMKCPLSGKDSGEVPGMTGRCMDCGRRVRTRKDGTYSPHDLPKDVERLRRIQKAWAESRKAERR